MTLDNELAEQARRGESHTAADLRTSTRRHRQPDRRVPNAGAAVDGEVIA